MIPNLRTLKPCLGRRPQHHLETACPLPGVPAPSRETPQSFPQSLPLEGAGILRQATTKSHHRGHGGPGARQAMLSRARCVGKRAPYSRRCKVAADLGLPPKLLSGLLLSLQLAVGLIQEIQRPTS